MTAEALSIPLGNGWVREGQSAIWLGPVDDEFGGDAMRVSLHNHHDGPRLHIEVATCGEPGTDVNDLLEGAGTMIELPVSALPGLFMLVGTACGVTGAKL